MYTYTLHQYIPKRTNKFFSKVYWTNNKAKGIVAQSKFFEEFSVGSFKHAKNTNVFPGCWLFSPKQSGWERKRTAFFVHPEITKYHKTGKKETTNQTPTNFKIVSDFLSDSQITVIYATPIAKNSLNIIPSKDDFDSLDGLDRFIIKPQKEEDKKTNKEIRERIKLSTNPIIEELNSCIEWINDIDLIEFFDSWEGTGGWASRSNKPWTKNTESEFEKLQPQTLEANFLFEFFHVGFLKTHLKKPFNDPYDVDGFLLNGSVVCPIEIKEKFPAKIAKNSTINFFGIDVGRVIMMLRLCIGTGNEAFYIIREMDEETKKFVEWKYMLLSDIIKFSSWNLSAGGIGMTGGATQTLRLPYNEFKSFSGPDLNKDIKKMDKFFENQKF